MLLDGHDVPLELRRLAARRGADVEGALAFLRLDDEPGELRAAALGPREARLDPGRLHTVDHARVGQVGIALARDGLRFGSPPAVDAHRGLGRLVLRPHARARTVRPQVAPPGLGHPVRVRMLEPRSGGRLVAEGVEQRADPLRHAAQHRVRERHRACDAGRAHQLDRLVHRRVARHAVDVAELVRTEAQGREHRRVELVHRPPAERLDRVVERARPLHGAVGEPLRQCAVARVEPGHRRAERAVGVGALLEHAPNDGEGRSPRGRDRHRSPRWNSS